MVTTLRLLRFARNDEISISMSLRGSFPFSVIEERSKPVPAKAGEAISTEN